MKKILAGIMIVVLTGTLTVGCTEVPLIKNELPEKESNFRLLVSDEAIAIGEFSSLNVTITKIGLNQAGDSGGWIYLDMDPETVDLTLLIGDNATEVFEGRVASGNYTKVVLYTENVTGVLLDGTSVNITLPSEKLQISKTFTLSDDMTVNFVFDIAVVKAGKSGKYILKPQIAESGPNQKYIDITPKGKTEKYQEKHQEKRKDKHGKTD